MSEDPSDDATVAFGGPSPAEVTIPGHRIVRQLGRGGMGAVYLGEDEALGRRVAIKVVADAIARDSAVRSRFLREARLLATIEHPNVVRVYSFGASDDRAYLVMEYVEGETLADRIQRGPFSIADARAVALGVAEALEAAWEKRIIHRDIKPSNILFDKRGNLKVADFGLAKGGEATGGDSSLTQTGYLLGSPHYVAPEQAQGHDSDFRADIYSLGVTLFEMLTGRKPFDGSSALAIISRHLHDDMPRLALRGPDGKKMADLVAWMTQKAPEDRPQSYAELREALQSIDGGETTVITKRARRSGPRPAKMVALGLASVCAIAMVVLNVIFWRNRQAEVRVADDGRLVVAVAPFWGPDVESSNEGKSMAALVQQQIVTRLGSAARVIGIEETKEPVRDADSARALGEKFDATAVIWGQAFALRNEREIQPSLTLVPRKTHAIANVTNSVASLAEVRSIGADIPAMPDAIRVETGGANQLDMRKSSAEAIGDLVTFIAAMQALRQNEPQRALELLAQSRKTPDALYQKAVCLANMKRDDDAAHELNEALRLDPNHAQSLAMLADIDSRAGHYADAASHLRAAAATGRRFTTAEAALYDGKLYVMERYFEDGFSRDTGTMLAIDPAADRVLARWELPGPPRNAREGDRTRPDTTVVSGASGIDDVGARRSRSSQSHHRRPLRASVCGNAVLRILLDRAQFRAVWPSRLGGPRLRRGATIERMLDAPFVRRAAYNFIVNSDPQRDHLWLTRAREITGLAWDGDEITSAAWARYFRDHGDPKTADAEQRIHDRTHEAFGGVRESLTAEDLMRALSIGALIAIVAVGAFTVRRRNGVPVMTRQGRVALALLAAVIVIGGAVRLFCAARVRLTEQVPVPSADSLTHPVILDSLEQLLAERPSNELRFITGTAQHLAGNTRRAAELYAAVPGDAAAENLNRLDNEKPPNMPSLDTWVAAFHRNSADALGHALRAAWQPRPQAGSAFTVAEYEASQLFYLALLLGVMLLLLAIGAGDLSRDVPALTLAVFVTSAVFLLVAVWGHRTWNARGVSGMYGASWSEPVTSAAPLPPDPGAEASVSKSLAGEDRVNAISEARASEILNRLEPMRAFWIAVSLAAIAAVVSGGLLARVAFRRRRTEPLLDQPRYVEA